MALLRDKNCVTPEAAQKTPKDLHAAKTWDVPLLVVPLADYYQTNTQNSDLKSNLPFAYPNGNNLIISWFSSVPGRRHIVTIMIVVATSDISCGKLISVNHQHIHSHNP